MYFARLSENSMSVCDKYFHFVFNITGNTSSDFLQKLQMSGEVFSPQEPSRAKFTPSGRVFRLGRPLAWTLVPSPSCSCSANFETEQHYFFECRNFENQSENLFRALSFISVITLDTLLYGCLTFDNERNALIINAVLLFIKETKRFD